MEEIKNFAVQSSRTREKTFPGHGPQLNNAGPFHRDRCLGNQSLAPEL
jgi:hypothetical protein